MLATLSSIPDDPLDGIIHALAEIGVIVALFEIGLDWISPLGVAAFDATGASSPPSRRWARWRRGGRSPAGATTTSPSAWG
jgi:hypothetical protein